MSLSKSFSGLSSPTGQSSEAQGAFNATYTINGTAQPARLLLLNDKAAIGLGAAEEACTVHWLYHNITLPASGNAVFSYTAYPPQTLEVLDSVLANALVARLRPSKRKAVSRRNRIMLGLFAGVALAIAAVYMYLLPWLAATLAARVPVSYEKELGDNVFASMKQAYTIDEARSAYTTAFFDALHFPATYPVRITVVKSEEANAFALPGGHIIVHDKLLNRLDAYPQLAALLAHEYVHIQNRHALKALFRRASTTLLLATLIGDAGAFGSVVLNSADNLRNLSYSRSLESEADTDGLALLTARNIDAGGFVQLFQILKRETQAGGPEWVSSHPNLENRIRNIRQHEAFERQQPRMDSSLRHLFLKIKTAD